MMLLMTAKTRCFGKGFPQAELLLSRVLGGGGNGNNGLGMFPLKLPGPKRPSLNTTLMQGITPLASSP